MQEFGIIPMGQHSNDGSQTPKLHPKNHPKPPPQQQSLASSYPGNSNASHFGFLTSFNILNATDDDIIGEAIRALTTIYVQRHPNHFESYDGDGKTIFHQVVAMIAYLTPLQFRYLKRIRAILKGTDKTPSSMTPTLRGGGGGGGSTSGSGPRSTASGYTTSSHATTMSTIDHTASTRPGTTTTAGHGSFPIPPDFPQQLRGSYNQTQFDAVVNYIYHQVTNLANKLTNKNTTISPTHPQQLSLSPSQYQHTPHTLHASEQHYPQSFHPDAHHDDQIMAAAGTPSNKSTKSLQTALLPSGCYQGGGDNDRHIPLYPEQEHKQQHHHLPIEQTPSTKSFPVTSFALNKSRSNGNGGNGNGKGEQPTLKTSEPDWNVDGVVDTLSYRTGSTTSPVPTHNGTLLRPDLSSHSHSHPHTRSQVGSDHHEHRPPPLTPLHHDVPSTHTTVTTTDMTAAPPYLAPIHSGGGGGGGESHHNTMTRARGSATPDPAVSLEKQSRLSPGTPNGGITGGMDQFPFALYSSDIHRTADGNRRGQSAATPGIGPSSGLARSGTMLDTDHDISENRPSSRSKQQHSARSLTSTTTSRPALSSYSAASELLQTPSGSRVIQSLQSIMRNGGYVKDHYFWSQTSETVAIYVIVPPDTRPSDLNLLLEKGWLSVTVKDRVVFSEQLYRNVEVRHEAVVTHFSYAQNSSFSASQSSRQSTHYKEYCTTTVLDLSPISRLLAIPGDVAGRNMVELIFFKVIDPLSPSSTRWWRRCVVNGENINISAFEPQYQAYLYQQQQQQHHQRDYDAAAASTIHHRPLLSSNPSLHASGVVGTPSMQTNISALSTAMTPPLLSDIDPLTYTGTPAGHHQQQHHQSRHGRRNSSYYSFHSGHGRPTDSPSVRSSVLSSASQLKLKPTFSTVKQSHSVGGHEVTRQSMTSESSRVIGPPSTHRSSHHRRKYDPQQQQHNHQQQQYQQHQQGETNGNSMSDELPHQQYHQPPSSSISALPLSSQAYTYDDSMPAPLALESQERHQQKQTTDNVHKLKNKSTSHAMQPRPQGGGDSFNPAMNGQKKSTSNLPMARDKSSKSNRDSVSIDELSISDQRHPNTTTPSGPDHHVDRPVISHLTTDFLTNPTSFLTQQQQQQQQQQSQNQGGDKVSYQQQKQHQHPQHQSRKHKSHPETSRDDQKRPTTPVSQYHRHDAS